MATGTVFGYGRHRLAGEPPCDACRLAHNAGVAAYRHRHPDRVRERDRAYRADRREELAAKQRAYWAANKDEANARRNERNRLNPEPNRERARRWAEANGERVLRRVKKWQAENPERTREIQQEAKQRRRARKRRAFVAPVDRAAIFVRDSFVCQLCKYPLDMEAKAPDDWSPVIDHIIPLAQGGTHEPANVQAAHFWCNSVKGGRHLKKALDRHRVR